MLVINKVPYYLSNGIIAEFKKDLEARDDHRTLLSDCFKEMDELKADILDHQPCNAPSLPWYAEYNRAEEVFDVLSQHNTQLTTLSSQTNTNKRRLNKILDTMTLMDETYGEDYLDFWSTYAETWGEILNQFYDNLGYWKKQKTKIRKNEKQKTKNKNYF